MSVRIIRTLHQGRNERERLLRQVRRGSTLRATLDWVPTCECDSGAMPCRVLDPFGGAGTTGMVADRLGRDAVLVELSPDYCRMIKRRLARDRLLRRKASMEDFREAQLEPTPLEALIEGAA